MAAMSPDPRVVRVVIASPGDVKPEREVAGRVLEELNRTIAADRGIWLQLVRWETDAYPGFHPEGPQGICDQVLEIEECGILIGIFWTRFGRPTADGQTGTEHEINKALESWKTKGTPQIMIFFNSAPPRLVSSFDRRQWAQIAEYRERFPNEGLYWEYENVDGFERELRHSLSNYVRHSFPLKGAGHAALAGDAVERRTVLSEIHRSTSGFDFAGYRGAIRRFFETVKLDTLDTSGQDYRVRLRHVFVPQNVKELATSPDIVSHIRHSLDSVLPKDRSAVRRSDTAQMRYEEGEALNIENVLADRACKHCVILGDAGAGKSSLAQNILLQWAEGSVSQLPLLFELRSYRSDLPSSHTFLEHFERSIAAVWHFPQQMLSHWLRFRQALVIFEGLDEMINPIMRHETTRAILRFSEEYPQARILVTSRSAGYDPQILLAGGFRHFLLQEFTAAQIRRFIESWHREAFANVAEQSLLSARLEQSLDDSRSIRDLAGNPLLLTMLALLNRNQELPRDRADAYEQMSRVLLHQWDVNKFLREQGSILGGRIGRKEKQELLRRVALRMQEGEYGLGANLIRQSELEDLISEYLRDVLRSEQPESGAVLIVRQLRERNFVLSQVGPEHIGFVHRTFLEYYCASAYVIQFHKTLSLDRLKAETFDTRWREEEWREILRLISAMIQPAHAETLIYSLLDRDCTLCQFENVFLAKDCWTELTDGLVKHRLRMPLWNKLRAAAYYRQPMERSPSRIAAAKGGPESKYQQRTHDDLEETHAIRALEVRTRAIESIGAVFADDPMAFEWLRNCAENHPSWAMRQASIRALARNFRTVGIAWLQWMARQQENENVRETAIQEAVRTWIDDPLAREWFKALGESDESTRIRMAASRALGSIRPRPADICEVLESLAESDQSESVRRFARQLLEDPPQ
jgi:hypothetical protein